MTATFTDLAGDTIRDMQREQILLHEEVGQIESNESAEVRSSRYLGLYEKVSYSWKPEDKNALAQLRKAAEVEIMDIFAPAFSILDSLYEAARIPEYTVHGQTRLDSEGRPVWAKDSNGVVVENWDAVTGQDIESALFRLATLKLSASQQVADLFLEAIFAKHSLTDSWNESYESVIEGTVADRNAKANRVTKTEKYFAYMRYYLWYKSDALIKEINQIMRILDRILEFRMRRKD